LTIDLRDAIRRHKPDKRRGRLEPRPPLELIAAADVAGSGRPMLMLDTNVYITTAAGTLPTAATALTETALLFHCSVCLGELATGVANADPDSPQWRAIRDHYTAIFDAVPSTRLLTPDPQTWADAGVVAGTLARTQGFQKHQRKECLNDALIYLTAARAGLPVLTANREEFDLIQQIAPDGRFIYF
jgi:predicted nucleic acid-binding protein